MSDKEKDYVTIWSKQANKALKGQTIKRVRWMTDKEVKEYDWNAKSVVIEFNSGLTILVSVDEEGNGPGALFTNHPNLSVIPSL